jgi:hypothetical protein
MNTKEIEEILKEQAMKLKKGSQKQKAFGQQVHALALEIEKNRKDSETPLDAENIKGIFSGGSDPRLSPRRKWPGR